MCSVKSQPSGQKEHQLCVLSHWWALLEMFPYLIDQWGKMTCYIAGQMGQEVLALLVVVCEGRSSLWWSSVREGPPCSGGGQWGTSLLALVVVSEERASWHWWQSKEETSLRWWWLVGASSLFMLMVCGGRTLSHWGMDLLMMMVVVRGTSLHWRSEGKVLPYVGGGQRGKALVMLVVVNGKWTSAEDRLPYCGLQCEKNPFLSVAKKINLDNVTYPRQT